MAVIKVKCPNCGKMIQTDDSLEKTFCVYCGTAIYAKAEPVLGAMAENEKTEKSEGEKASSDIPISQMTYEQLLAKGQQMQKEAIEQAKIAMNGTVTLGSGVLYSEASEEEKKNPKKLKLKEYLKRELGFEKKVTVLAVLGFIIFIVGLIVLTAAFNVVAVGIVISIAMIIALNVGLKIDMSKKRCAKCKTDFVTADIAYEFKGNIRKHYGKDDEKTARFKRYRFTIKCPKCGREKIFEEDVPSDNGHIDLRRYVGRKQEKDLVGKGKWKTLGIMLGIIALGLVLLIVGSVILVNNPFSKGKDPKDYYGTYYGEKDCVFYEVSFDVDHCVYVLSNGIFDEPKKEYTYEYYSAKSAQKFMPNEEYKGCPAIIVYEDSSQNSGYVLWIVSKEGEPYRFVLNSTGAELTKSYVALSQVMNDPSDYLGTYSYDNNNWVKFESNNTAYFRINGQTEMYDYAYVNEQWAKKYLSGHSSSALVLFQAGHTNEFQVFDIQGGGLLRYRTYNFYKQ